MAATAFWVVEIFSRYIVYNADKSSLNLGMCTYLMTPYGNMHDFLQWYESKMTAMAYYWLRSFFPYNFYDI